MWGKIGQWALNAFVLPLLTRIGKWIIDYIADKIRRNKLDKVNKAKVKKYVEATKKSDARDAFNNLP